MHGGIHSIPELRSFHRLPAPQAHHSSVGPLRSRLPEPLATTYTSCAPGNRSLQDPPKPGQLSAPPAVQHRRPGGEREASGGGGFRGPPAPGLRLQVHTRSPAGAPSRSPAAPLPARPFFSIHADAQGCRRRRRQRGRRRRPSGLAGGRGAGTFPRPAARAAHRRRCRRGPGARPGQSGRAGWGGAVASAGLVSRAGPQLLPAAGPPPPAPPAAPSRAPAEPTHCRRAGAGSGGGAQPASASARPAPWAAANPRCEAPIGRSPLLPRSRGPASAPRTSPPPPPSPGPWEGAQRGKGMVEF